MKFYFHPLKVMTQTKPIHNVMCLVYLTKIAKRDEVGTCCLHANVNDISCGPIFSLSFSYMKINVHVV